MNLRNGKINISFRTVIIMIEERIIEMEKDVKKKTERVTDKSRKREGERQERFEERDAKWMQDTIQVNHAWMRIKTREAYEMMNFFSLTRSFILIIFLSRISSSKNIPLLLLSHSLSPNFFTHPTF